MAVKSPTIRQYVVVGEWYPCLLRLCVKAGSSAGVSISRPKCASAQRSSVIALFGSYGMVMTNIHYSGTDIQEPRLSLAEPLSTCIFERPINDGNGGPCRTFRKRPTLVLEKMATRCPAGRFSGSGAYLRVSGYIGQNMPVFRSSLLFRHTADSSWTIVYALTSVGAQRRLRSGVLNRIKPRLDGCAAARLSVQWKRDVHPRFFFPPRICRDYVKVL